MDHLSQLLSGISGIFWAVVALGVLIFAHEFGHFLFAKLSGVGVLKFSLGFGRKLIGRKIGETEYLVSALPLGGYVKLLGEEEGEDLSEADKARSFVVQPAWKRFFIVFAGPAFNIILAVLLCYIVMLTGDPTPVARVADVVPASPAEAAGFRKGDIIKTADGEKIYLWLQLAHFIDVSAGKDVRFTVDRGGVKDDITVKLSEKEPFGQLGLMGAVIIAARKDGSPADRAGIVSGDRVLAIDGVRVGRWSDMADIIKASPGKELTFTIMRAGRTFDAKITPELGKSPEDETKQVGLVGIMPGSEEEMVRYGPVEAIGQSVDRSLYFSEVIVGFLARLIGGKEDATQIGGPIAIVQLSERQAKQGFADFVLFMAMLSINLGIINVIPIPVLDGGHLFFLGLEAVMGRPLSMRKREIAQQIGLVIIIGLMAIVFGMDILRAFGFLDMWR